MKKWTCLTFLFLIASCRQTHSLAKMDAELTQSYNKMLAAQHSDAAENEAHIFKDKFLLILSNPVSFTQHFDSLEKYVKICVSKDKKIKFYSWDDYLGGTWHSINCVAQFQTQNKKTKIQEMNKMGEGIDKEDFTDSNVYEIHDISINKQSYYLTFGWGTHGGGQQYDIIQIFTIADNQLEKCTACLPYNYNKALVIEYPRSEHSDLVYNPQTKEISYNEFVLGEETGFYKRTGKIIRLQFIGNRFVRR